MTRIDWTILVTRPSYDSTLTRLEKIFDDSDSKGRDSDSTKMTRAHH